MTETSQDHEEKTILRQQSCLSFSPDGPWKTGFLYLTNKRILFLSPSRRVVLETPLEKLEYVKLTRGRFILGVKKWLLHLLFNGPSLLDVKREKTYQAFIAMNHPEEWKEAIWEAHISHATSYNNHNYQI